MAEDRHSPYDLEVLRSSELFPKKEVVCDDGPMPEITTAMHGESFLFCSRCGKDNSQYVLLSTYRLIVVLPAQWFIVVPVGMLLSVEAHDTLSLVVKFKDGRHCSVQFSSGDRCSQWQSRILSAISVPTQVQDFFAFAFHAWLIDTNELLSQQSPDSLSWFYGEIDRLGFHNHPLWRSSDGNFEFDICHSYPRLTIVPASMKEDEIRRVAKHRSQGRYPAIVWRHRGNGAVLARCSQPLVGLLGYQRCIEDEKLIEEIAKAVVLDRALATNIIHRSEVGSAIGDPNSNLGTVLGKAKAAQIDALTMLVVDMRTYTAAMANRSRGGGTECKDYYPCIDAVFHKVPNIHSVAQSFDALSSLCQHQHTNTPTWLSQLEHTQWLHYLSGLLESAVHIAHALCVEARPVLVHCSDGWDRTSQATALTQLLVDPYYRTFEGFTILVKREWLAFGHKFASRCGHATHNESSPVFVQWLDAVHQLMQQFPMAFEYNETFLIKLATHVYSHLFGNFLCNREKDRIDNTMKAKTLDIWVVLNKDRKDFINYLYNKRHNDVIVPRFGVQHLVLWTRMYMQPVRQVMPGGANVTDGPNLLSPAAASTTPAPDADSEISPFEAAMRASLQVSAKPNSLLECLQVQQRNKEGGRADPRSSLSPPPGAGDGEAGVQQPPPPASRGRHMPSSSSTTAVSRSPAQSIPTSRSAVGARVPGRGGGDGAGDAEPVLSASYEYVNWSSPSAASLNSFRAYQPPPISGSLPSGAAHLAPAAVAGDGGAAGDGAAAGGRGAAAGNRELGFRVASAAVITTPRRRRAAELCADAHPAEEALVECGGRAGDGTSTVATAAVEALFSASSSSSISPSSSSPLHRSELSTTSVEEVTTPRNEASASMNSSCERLQSQSRSSTHSHGTSSTTSADPPLIELAVERATAATATAHASSTRPLSLLTSLRNNGGGATTVTATTAAPSSSPPKEMPSTGMTTTTAAPAAARTRTRQWKGAKAEDDSGCPSSPSSPSHSSRDSSEAAVERGASQAAAHECLIPQHLMDADGLPLPLDAVQTQLYRTANRHCDEVRALRGQVTTLHQRLELAKRRASEPRTVDQLAGGAAFGAKSGGAFPDTDEDGEVDDDGDDVPSSNSSSVKSTLSMSWEDLQKGDGQPTRWVPDHAVNNCTDCAATFWLYNRKHHCRNCGGVFCGRCSNYNVPVMKEQLRDPVRVCRSCFDKLDGPRYWRDRALSAAMADS